MRVPPKQRNPGDYRVKKPMGVSAIGRRIGTMCGVVTSSRSATEDGRQLRILVVIDEFTRQCLAVEVARSFTARDMIVKQEVGTGCNHQTTSPSSR
jgi:hypothetical protein